MLQHHSGEWSTKQGSKVREDANMARRGGIKWLYWFGVVGGEVAN